MQLQNGGASVKTDIRNPSHRNDIQGLRAIGALLVAIYHIWVGRVSGGVDVFFVVSGYLLIGSLSRNLKSTGSVDVVEFVLRLTRRLIPASFFVVICIVATGWIWLPKMQWEQAYYQATASTLYIQNWFLAFNSVDYLARDIAASPTQHYWAMSLQVQALIFFAGSFFLFGKLSKFFGLHLSNKSIGGFLTLIFALSLGYSIIRTNQNQAFTYYDTWARLWEFAIGGILAATASHLNVNNTLKILLGWSGLTALLCCGVVLEVSNVFPGYAALWPTMAAAAILLSGTGSQPPFSVFYLLGSRPLVWIGGISYCLYLWHWPILVAYQSATYKTGLSIAEGTAILIISILLSVLTKKYVEGIFQKTYIAKNRWKTIAATSISALIVGGAIFGWHNHRKAIESSEAAILPGQSIYSGAQLSTLSPGSGPIFPSALTIRRNPGQLDPCYESMSGTELISCTYGPKDAEHSLIVVGGSHSEQWLPALTTTIARHPNWKIVTFLKSACPFSLDPIGADKTFQMSCLAWNQKLTQLLLKEQPSAVFLLATRTTYPGRQIEHVPEGYRAQWKPLIEADIKVIAMRDTPRFGFNVPECVDALGPNHPRCNLTSTELLAPENPALHLDEAKKLHLLDLSDSFCNIKCPPVIGNIMVYRDKGHVSAAYMITLANRLSQELDPILTSASVHN